MLHLQGHAVEHGGAIYFFPPSAAPMAIIELKAQVSNAGRILPNCHVVVPCASGQDAGQCYKKCPIKQELQLGVYSFYIQPPEN